MAKTKLKTNKSTAKRIKVTKKGKLLHSKTCRNHLLLNKGNATKKNKFGKELTGKEVKNLKRVISAKLR